MIAWPAADISRKVPQVGQRDAGRECGAHRVPGTARQQMTPAAAGGRCTPVRPGSAEGTPMQELRLVAVSEDGTYVVLAQPGRATRFTLPNDERLRAVVRGQFSRLAQYEIEVESPLRPKEIQARIRSGETAEQIADAADVPIERVRWFEGPVLAERAYIAQQAQTASVRRPGDAGPGPRLGEIVAERLRVLGADPDEAQWDSRKRGDGSWLVELTSGTGVERLTAAWVFDPRRRHAMPDDDEAARLSLPEEALQAAGLAVQQAAAARGRGTVTPFVPRSHPPAARPAAEPESEPASQRRIAAGGPANVPAGRRQPMSQPMSRSQCPSRLPSRCPIRRMRPDGTWMPKPPSAGAIPQVCRTRIRPRPGCRGSSRPRAAPAGARCPSRSPRRLPGQIRASPPHLPRARNNRTPRTSHQPRESLRPLTRHLPRSRTSQSRPVAALAGRPLVVEAAVRQYRPGTRSCSATRAARTRRLRGSDRQNVVDASSAGDADVSEQGHHLQAQRLVVPVDVCPMAGSPADPRVGDAGQEGRDDLFPEGEQSADGTGGSG